MILMNARPPKKKVFILIKWICWSKEHFSFLSDSSQTVWGLRVSHYVCGSRDSQRRSASRRHGTPATPCCGCVAYSRPDKQKRRNLRSDGRTILSSEWAPIMLSKQHLLSILVHGVCVYHQCVCHLVPPCLGDRAMVVAQFSFFFGTKSR